jgi:enoyl-CoA hydratase/3-hydroxyacyl-CoA dehydrogenase
MAEAGESFYGEGDEDEETGPSFEDIAVEIEGPVGHVQLDREHRMNALTPELVDELAEAVDMFEADPDVRVMLLTGAGDRAFSAGADAQSFLGSANPIDAVELSKKGQSVFGKLEETGMPVLAAIDGYCLGGGMELAAAADIRIASDRSEFGQPEFDLGLLPGWGGTQRLRHIVGDGRAKEIIFTADRYEAEEMADFGFVNEVVDRDEFEDRAWEFAEELASGPPIAQRYTKRAMLAGRESTEAGLRVEAQAFGQLIGTDDFNEGVMAFIEDRDPEFSGE